MTRRVGLPLHLELPQSGWPASFSPALTEFPQFARYGSWRSGGVRPFHCFVDDWRIEVFWRRPEVGLAAAVAAGVCIGPDFSIFPDDPLPWSRFQFWRTRMIEHYWRSHGVTVIPCLQWLDLEHIGLGIKRGSAVAVRGPTKGFEREWIDHVFRFFVESRPAQVLVFGLAPANAPFPFIRLPLNGRRIPWEASGAPRVAANPGDSASYTVTLSHIGNSDALD